MTVWNMGTPIGAKAQKTVVARIDRDLTGEEALEIDGVLHVHAADLDLPDVAAIGLGAKHGRCHRRRRTGILRNHAPCGQRGSGKSGNPERADELQGIPAAYPAAQVTVDDICEAVLLSLFHDISF